MPDPLSRLLLLAASFPVQHPSFGSAYSRRSGSAASDRLAAAAAQSLRIRLAPAREVPHPWQGQRGGRSRLALGARMAGVAAWKVLAFILWAQVAYVAATSLILLCYKWVDPPATVLMYYRRFETGYQIAKTAPVHAQDLSRRRKNMLVKVEDWTFYSHHGFDLAAIKYAATINKRRGRLVSGASTLSMQTARSLFLIPVKSYFRKYLEAIATVELELIDGKERILELYFSSAEWGKGLFGIQAASRKYYDRPIQRISDEEYIKLVSLLPSPLRFTPSTLFGSRALSWRYDYLAGIYLAPSNEEAANASPESEGPPPPAPAVEDDSAPAAPVGAPAAQAAERSAADAAKNGESPAAGQPVPAPSPASP